MREATVSTYRVLSSQGPAKESDEVSDTPGGRSQHETAAQLSSGYLQRHETGSKHERIDFNAAAFARSRQQIEE